MKPSRHDTADLKRVFWYNEGITKTKMQINLEDFTPYSRSLKWQIHNNYFQKKGAQAWLKSEVPYDITCNSCAAWQNALLVFEAVKKIEANGALATEEPINLLELASGVGLFAINFIDQFALICNKHGKNYHERLVYFFTDYSRINLMDAMKNRQLQILKKSGKIRFAEVDACDPRKIIDIDTGKQIGGIKFAAAIANYLHCVLPLAILRKNNDRYFEKNVALSYEVADKRVISDEKKFVSNLVNNPVTEQVLENIKEKSIYLPIDVNSYFKDKSHWEVIAEMSRPYDPATILYPYGSFDAVKNFMPLMKRGSIYIISDKGYPSSEYMMGEKECTPSLHGNCFAHSVNFPMLALYAKKLGMATYKTANPDYGIQTIVIDSGFNHDLKKLFGQIFIDENRNQDSSDFVTASFDYDKNKDYEKALIFIKKAIKARPFDARLYMREGEAYLNLGFHDLALESFEKGQQYDYFNISDFDFSRGRVYYRMSMDEKALECYAASLDKFGPDSGVYLNIGLCHEMLGNVVQAEQFYNKSLDLDPEYDRATEGLERLKKAAKEKPETISVS
jgi:tetratricopeptide (TPR) repeat protein